MTKQQAIFDLLLLFCKELPKFEIKVNRLNDLSDDDWILFQEYIEAYSRVPWLTATGVMEAVDSIIDESITYGNLILTYSR